MARRLRARHRVATSPPKASLPKRIARWVGGILLLLGGLVLSVPGIPGPGIVVILVGVFVLLPESRWLRKKYAAVKRRYPRVFAAVERRWRRTRRRRPT